MTLRDLQKRHMRQTLGNTRWFAEPVTYRFKSGDPDRELNAVVKRLELEPSSPQAAAVRKRRCDVEIPRHATLGVLTIENGDSIVLPVRIGEDPVDCRIRRVIAQDDAQFVVQVEE